MQTRSCNPLPALRCYVPRHCANFSQHARSIAQRASLSEVETSSLAVLEWGSVCRQVSCFCGTSMAAQRLQAAGLPLGRSIEQSQMLLQQTEEAMQAGLRVQGVHDLTPALQAVSSGQYLSAKQLQGVAGSLEAALALKAQVAAPAQQPGAEQAQTATGAAPEAVPASPAQAAVLTDAKLPSLAALAAGISDQEQALVTAIRHCIRLGSVADEASEALATVRGQRRDVNARLRSAMEELARTLHDKGASDSRNLSIMRNRLCVGLKAGRKGELPKGSVKLGASQTGATQYYEPTFAIPLNNEAALLAEREEEEERRVLVLLSQMLLQRVAEIQQLQEAVVELDVVAARAGHARWLSGVRPDLVTTLMAGHDGRPLLSVPGALHPVLLERVLGHSLPQPPAADEKLFERNYAAAPAWELPRPSSPSPPAPDSSSRPGIAPRPLDLRVPAGKRVVAITGPNTGGKTVTLKTVGLLVLMAKAGLFLPMEPSNPPGPSCSAQLRPAKPCIAWFGSVLADIGDTQSLQQNLSTFSGHVKRIQQVLATARPDSLVLLDEVGSGTDPVEGAALARAILDHLASRVALTLATTHHAELKHAVDEDSKFTNVSMEFDVASLQPTYRLMWGTAGASNALDIAQTLGFDSAVLAEAREVARSTLASQGERSARMAATAASLMEQLEDATAELNETRARRQAGEAAAQQLQEELRELAAAEAKLKRLPTLIVKRRDTTRQELQQLLAEFEKGRSNRAEVELRLSRLEADIPERVAAYLKRSYQSEDAPDIGDIVVVPERHGEAQFRLSGFVGPDSVRIEPLSATGLGAALLSFSKKGKKSGGGAITVPKATIKLARRAMTHLPTSIPSTLDPDVRGAT
ncbi:hypothetical protein V8C86DRAFT_2464886 [Haematococcus lacustris]